MRIKLDPAAVVAGAAFIGSAGHIMSVVSETNPWFITPVYPIGIDGLLYVGMKYRRSFAGIFALVIGTAYSLAFNGHAEGALDMPKLMIASSLPVCMLMAFVIEAIAHTETKPPKTVEIEKIVYAYPELLPIVPPTPVKINRTDVDGRTDVDVPRGRTDGRGRIAAWDVEKAVRLLMDGRTDVDVLQAVDGLTEKPWQRTKRCVRMINEGADDAMISATVKVSATHVARIREAMQ